MNIYLNNAKYNEISHYQALNIKLSSDDYRGDLMIRQLAQFTPLDLWIYPTGWNKGETFTAEQYFTGLAESKFRYNKVLYA